jgi:hypothetical protein
MGRTLAAATAVLMISTAVSPALAAERCAKPDDVTAMQASAVQQQLMVAALSCDALAQYNSFVTAYQPELYAADRHLMKYFKRMKARGGEADYHAFKTRMANMSSTLSISNLALFCQNARAAFDLALGPTKSTLAAFVATQPIVESSDFARCEIRVAGGIVPGAPTGVPIPLDKPGREPGPGTIPGAVGAVGTVVTAPVRAVGAVVKGIFSNLPGAKPASGGTQ